MRVLGTRLPTNRCKGVRQRARESTAAGEANGSGHSHKAEQGPHARWAASETEIPAKAQPRDMRENRNKALTHHNGIARGFKNHDLAVLKKL